jgi:hypothetical protein
MKETVFPSKTLEEESRAIGIFDVQIMRHLFLWLIANRLYPNRPIDHS